MIHLYLKIPDLCASHSPRWILGWACTTCSYGQIKKFAQLPVDYLLHSIMFIIISNLLLARFSHWHYLEVFHWSLSEGKSLQVSNTLLGILADPNNVVVLMVSILLISNFSSPLSKPLRSVPTRIGITVMLIFHCF